MTAFLKILRYRVSFWSKGYNKGKVNIVLTAESGETLLVENLTPDQGTFMLEMLKGQGVLTCDPESADGLVHLTTELNG